MGTRFLCVHQQPVDSRTQAIQEANQPDSQDDEEVDLDNMFYSYLMKNYSLEDYSDSEDEIDDLDIIKFEKIPKTKKKV